MWRTRLAKLFATTLQDEEQFYLTDLVDLVNKGLSDDQQFGGAEATQACQAMSNDEELMLSDGIVYKI